MEPFPLAWAAEILGAKVVGAAEGITVRGVCTDTRQGAEGALFFALPGENADGHRYVAQAFEKGAAGAVVSQEVEGAPGPLLVAPDTLKAFGDLAMHYRRQFDIPVVGVTGSVGKTSTKEMIAAVLRTKYNTLASVKNYNNEIGVPQTIFQLTKAHQAAVIEMGMRALGEIDRLAEVAQPTVGVITNIGLAHIELLGTQENIAQAKAELLARLPPDGAAVLPRESDFYDYLRRRVPRDCRTLTFTASPAVKADVSLNARGPTAFSALVRETEYEGAFQVVGTHHLQNAAAALAVALAFYVPIEEALTALKEWKGADGRMTFRVAWNDATLLDDCYNAGVESMTSALETLCQVACKGRVAVLGDMKELGDFAREAHQRVGHKVIEAELRLLVTVGALAEEIASEAARYAEKRKAPEPAYWHFVDTDSAAATIRRLVQPQDTVLVKGSRAMQMEKIVAALTGEQVAEAHA
jgi:UDP-N-acetylmuramoyl-tripeptide--D-alanyl-D-alanine ligase